MYISNVPPVKTVVFFLHPGAWAALELRLSTPSQQEVSFSPTCEGHSLAAERLTALVDRGGNGIPEVFRGTRAYKSCFMTTAVTTSECFDHAHDCDDDDDDDDWNADDDDNDLHSV